MLKFITTAEFIKIIKSDDFLSLVDKYQHVFSSTDCVEEIKSPSKFFSNSNYIPYTRSNIFVTDIMGQVGQYNDCNFCCHHFGYNNSTWISALQIKRSQNFKILELIRISPEYYYEEIIKPSPLKFVTIDHKYYYSEGCSLRAIASKLLLTLHFKLTGVNVPLKNVLVKKVEARSNSSL